MMELSSIRPQKWHVPPARDREIRKRNVYAIPERVDEVSPGRALREAG
jgi:hypothetical protein